MFTYKQEPQAEASSGGTVRATPHVFPHVILDPQGKPYTACPADGSEQQVAQEVDRLNANEHITQILRALARDGNEDDRHG